MLKVLKNKTLFVQAIIVIALFLAVVLPRYLAHTKYDATEDELIAIGNNLTYSITDFIWAPDFTHPGLWYMVSDLPTEWWKIEYGILPYRLFNSTIFALFCCTSYLIFRKKLEVRFLGLFFVLILTNFYILHVTFQNRMYGLVMGISVVYSLYWYYLIKIKPQSTYKTFMYLGLLAALGFFSSYSFIWLLPVFPLTYLFLNHAKNDVKKLMAFSFSSILAVSWFIPTFIKNITTSVGANQWAPDFNFLNVVGMVGNYLGVLSPHDSFNILNKALVPYLLLLLLLVLYQFFIKKSSFSLSLVTSFFITFALYLFSIYQTKNSLLYARTSIPLALVIIVFIADTFSSSNKLHKLFVALIVVLELTQLNIYFSPNNKYELEYDFVNYRRHPTAFFSGITLGNNACLISVPNWNELANQYYFRDRAKIVAIYYPADSSDLAAQLSGCENIYELDQVSVDRSVVDREKKIIKDAGLIETVIAKNENQVLFRIE